MSSEKSRHNRYKNELIFGSSPSDTLSKPTRDANGADERVDLEIILFGPRRRYLSDVNKLEPKRDLSTGPDLSEFDPFPSSAKEDKSERPGETSGLAKSADEPKSSPSRDNRKNNGKKVKNPPSDRTLDRMERMYKDVVAGGSSAGNGTYIDYMDYF